MNVSIKLLSQIFKILKSLKILKKSTKILFSIKWRKFSNFQEAGMYVKEPRQVYHDVCAQNFK